MESTTKKCFTCGGELAWQGDAYCAECVAKQTAEQMDEREAFDAYHQWADSQGTLQRTTDTETEDRYNQYLSNFKANFGDEADILPMSFDDWHKAQTKTLTMEEWKYQKYHGYAETKPDGSRYLLYMDDNGATVWGRVEIVG